MTQHLGPVCLNRISMEQRASVPRRQPTSAARHRQHDGSQRREVAHPREAGRCPRLPHHADPRTIRASRRHQGGAYQLQRCAADGARQPRHHSDGYRRSAGPTRIGADGRLWAARIRRGLHEDSLHPAERRYQPGRRVLGGRQRARLPGTQMGRPTYSRSAIRFFSPRNTSIWRARNGRTNGPPCRRRLCT